MPNEQSRLISEILNVYLQSLLTSSPHSLPLAKISRKVIQNPGLGRGLQSSHLDYLSAPGKKVNKVTALSGTPKSKSFGKKREKKSKSFHTVLRGRKTTRFQVRGHTTL